MKLHTHTHVSAYRLVNVRTMHIFIFASYQKTMQADNLDVRRSFSFDGISVVKVFGLTLFYSMFAGKMLAE